MDAPIPVGPFIAFTLGMVVYFIGAGITRNVAALRAWSIPEPVTGGVLAALAVWAFVAVAGRELAFDLYARDVLLVMFFACIGLNARIADLQRGGRALGLLLAVTVGYIVLQNLVALGATGVLGLPTASAPLYGSAALLGGHGTVIAWAPVIARDFGIPNAMEAGVAAATLGLIAASFLGGPIGAFLVERRGLQPADADAPDVVGLSFEDEATPQIDYVSFMRALLAVNLVVIAGYVLHQRITALGLKVPLFVPCLLVGVAVANVLPLVAPRMERLGGTPPLALIAEFSLSVFLAMSLMTMQLWTLAGVAGPLLAVIAVQVAVMAVFVVFVVFPLLGGDYRAAVLSSGFVGFGLGATPTAIASMTAVTKRYGPSPTAFIILPLVSAFFIDLINAAAIQLMLAL